MITTGLKEYDVRNVPGDETNIETIRFADDYENNLAAACRLTKCQEQGYVAIQNEGYSKVVVETADQAERLMAAIQVALELGWFK